MSCHLILYNSYKWEYNIRFFMAVGRPYTNLFLQLVGFVITFLQLYLQCS